LDPGPGKTCPPGIWILNFFWRTHGYIEYPEVRLLMSRSSQPAFLVFLVLLWSFFSIVTVPAFAEGERYDRLEVIVPVQSEEDPGMDVLSDLKADVIVSAFTRVNRSMDIPTASNYASHVLEAAGEFGIHPFMIASIIIRESTVRQNARSRYAYGLMQINWKAHRKGLTKAFSTIRTLDDLLQPRNNIFAGTYIFSWYLRSSDGDMDKALSKYLGRTGKKYVSRVMSGYRDMIKDLEERKDKYGSETVRSSSSVAFAVE
jgi:hypothetical protein